MSGLVADGVLTLCCADMDARPLFWTTPSSASAASASPSVRGSAGNSPAESP